MTYDVSKLPAVRAQLERDIAAAKTGQSGQSAPVPEYARAPISTGGQAGAGRPPATQGTTR